MFMSFGSPLSLNTIDVDPLPIKGLKDKFEILIIDDTPCDVGYSATFWLQSQRHERH